MVGVGDSSRCSFSDEEDGVVDCAVCTQFVVVDIVEVNTSLSLLDVDNEIGSSC